MAVQRPRALRVHLLISSYWPEHSPPQRRWSNFVREMTDNGWEVRVITPYAHQRELAHDQQPEAAIQKRNATGIHGEKLRRVAYLPMPHSRLGRFIDHTFSALLSIPRALFLKKPDVVVATVPSLPLAVSAFVVAQLTRAPLVLDMRDAWPDLVRDARLVTGNAKSLMERVIQGIQRRSDLVITVTEGFASTLRQRGVNHVVTISNGVEVEKLPALEPPTLSKPVLDVLYLGNHGESQKLDISIRAAALLKGTVRLHLVGDGVQKPHLQALAAELGAPVSFSDPVYGPEQVLEKYTQADSCIISLRDDWKSFETTIPSKTYEVMAVGRHVTGVVKGEAAAIITAAGVGDVVEATPQAIAELWQLLAADRSRLRVGQMGRSWVNENADSTKLAEIMVHELSRFSPGTDLAHSHDSHDGAN